MTLLLERLRPIRRKLMARLITYDKYYLRERDLSQPVRSWKPSIGVQFRKGTPADIDSLTREMGYSESRKVEAKEDLERGDLLLVGDYQGQIASVAWLSLTELKIYGKRISLGPGWAASNIALTALAYRRKGIQSAGDTYKMALLKELGVRRVIGWLNQKNLAMLRDTEKTGWSIVAQFRSVMLFARWRIVWLPHWLPGHLRADLERPHANHQVKERERR